MTRVACTVNGMPVEFEAEDRTLLVYALRDHLKLCGTNIGCDTSQCGACTVHVDGRSVKSCTVLVGQINGSAVTTIEGLSSGEELHPMQQAFRDHHGLQCGYCTSGMIMQALEIVRRFGTELDEQTIREELDGNICRCTGYHNIVLAIQAGARAMRDADAR
jgi:carbon-monoxide dehydrogenase small subunit